jgi:Peptidase family M48
MASLRALTRHVCSPSWILHQSSSSKNGLGMALNHKEGAQPRFQGNTMRTGFSRRGVALSLLGAFMAVGTAGCTSQALQAGLHLGQGARTAREKAAQDRLASLQWQRLKQSTPHALTGPAVNQVRRLVGQIAATSPVWQEPVEVVIFETTSLDAIVLPGGRIGVHQGMMDVLQDDLKVSALLAHEAAVLTGGAIPLPRSGQISSHNSAPLDPRALPQTDADAVNTLARAGYDPRGLALFWDLLAAGKQQGLPVPYLDRLGLDPQRKTRTLDALKALGYQV